jgi:hypothetical protein
MPKPMTIAAILLSLLSQAGSSSLSSPQSHRKPSRDESTKAIRATAYSMMKAFLTQDVATFRRLSAKRTLQLVSLTFEAAREDSQYKQELEKAHITNADQFLGYFLQGMANQYLQAVPLSPEAAARRAANDSSVTFITDAEARIAAGNSEVARARLVGKEWKIDLTDWLKRGVLAEVKDPAMRAKIKSL